MIKIVELLLLGYLAFWIFFQRPKQQLRKSTPKTAPAENHDTLRMVSCEFCKIQLPVGESYAFDQRYFCSLEHFHIIDPQGWLGFAKKIPSPNCDNRPKSQPVDTVVLHHISLPEGQFGGTNIQDFFTNQLNLNADPYFLEIAHLEVSAHFFIRRDGELLQFVSTQQRAWHAGQSELFERSRVNDFSIGVELEGTGEIPFEKEQYDCLARLTAAIEQRYEIRFFVGHSDISPERKKDPGKSFQWDYFKEISKIPEKKLPFGVKAR